MIIDKSEISKYNVVKFINKSKESKITNITNKDPEAESISNDAPPSYRTDFSQPLSYADQGIGEMDNGLEDYEEEMEQNNENMGINQEVREMKGNEWKEGTVITNADGFESNEYSQFANDERNLNDKELMEAPLNYNGTYVNPSTEKSMKICFTKGKNKIVFDRKQVKMGLKEEKHHFDGVKFLTSKEKEELTKKVVNDHLKEDSEYYTKLKKMEEK